MTWLIGLAPAWVQAQVHLPKVFGSHMVLQRDVPLPIWGTSEQGETVTAPAPTRGAGAFRCGMLFRLPESRRAHV